MFGNIHLVSVNKPPSLLHSNRITADVINNKRQIHYINVLPLDFTDSDVNYKPTLVDVENGRRVPIVMIFKGSAARLLLKTVSKPNGSTTVEHTWSNEEPQISRHTVTVPIVQVIHERILPRRMVMQTIQPVQEVFHTVVVQKEDKGQPS